MTLAFHATVDVRTIPPRDRHPVIFATFSALPQGQAMQLVNDHDPRPLYHQFELKMPGGFGWEYVEAGPDTWRVAITRLADAQPAQPVERGGCCGGT